MGSFYTHLKSGIDLYMKPEITPSPYDDPTFPPLDGFAHGRKKRVMIATDAEMRSAKIPLEHRDYCAHFLLKFRDCRKENFPFVIMCQHEKHEYLNCQNEDFIMRMKEYERERRLREKRYKEKQSSPECKT